MKKLNEWENSNIWLAMFIPLLLIFFFAFIEGGTIVAFFFLIWFSGLILTIISVFRFHINLELRDIEKTIKRNDLEIEIINRSCIMIKEKNEFRITEEYFYHKIGSLAGIIIMILVTVPIFFLEILLQVLKYMEIRDYSPLIAIILIFIIPFNIPFIIAYLHYRNRKTVCLINKDSEIILFKKLMPRYKILKKIIFSEIKLFEYIYSDPMSSCYTLRFTDINGVKITVFEGDEEKCIDIYNKISDFLGFKFPNE
ncbi:MAG: hypothetical protein EU529_13580 [Promethearchaeota archaeon]|nr:MAG: hypothetical protein EU529_13580 [Candidatus Lokiarchaeota archaeon]